MSFNAWLADNLAAINEGCNIGASFTVNNTNRGDGFPIVFSIQVVHTHGMVRVVLGPVAGPTSVLVCSEALAEKLADNRRLALSVRDARKGWYA